MRDNCGYVYVGLTRCKSFDHFCEPQCFCCYKFNHFADDCPDKDMPATCGKCARRHKTKDYDSNSIDKFVNCVQNREIKVKYDAFSRESPAMVKARAFVIRKTDSMAKKNY